MRATLRVVAWVSGLGAALAALHALGSGPLVAPPLTGGGHALSQWTAGRDAPTIVVAILRVLAMAIAAYLLMATALASVARATRSTSLTALSDRVTVELVRRVVAGSIGVAIAAGPLAAASGAWASPPLGMAAAATAGFSPPPPPAGPPDGPPLLRRLPDAADDQHPTGSPGPAPVAAATPITASSPAPVLAPSPTAAPSPSPSANPAPSSPGAVPAETAPLPSASTWTVRPGEHLWSIAASTLRAARGRAVSDAEIGPYWAEVVRQNRDRLPDPANADLLYAGMTVIVPPVP